MDIGTLAAIISTGISGSAFILSLYLIFSGRHQKQLDNLISIQTFLHRDDLSEARRLIRERALAISLSTPEVRRVCSSFDFAGCLVRRHAVSRQIFLDYWSGMLLSLHEIFADLSAETTGSSLRVCDYYKDFWWLMEEAKKRTCR